MNELAIVILGFKRYRFLERCLASFARNADAALADFYLYQDGAVSQQLGIRYADDGEIAQSVKVFEDCGLPNKTLVRQEYNIGTASQVCQAFANLFEKGHLWVTVLSDDYVVNRFYIKTLRTLYKQFQHNPKAGLLRTGPMAYPGRDGHVQSFEEAKAVEDVVDFGEPERWDLGIWRRTWVRLGPVMEAYHGIVKDYDYRQLIGCRWAGAHPELKPVVRRLEKEFGTLHEDFVPDIAVRRLGMEVLYTLAPRCLALEANSTMGRPNTMYWKLGLDRLVLHDVGDVDEYCFAHDVRDQFAEADSGLGRAKMVYRGNDRFPFSIRGDKSRKEYWRIEKGVPIDVDSADIPFLEKHGFKRA